MTPRPISRRRALSWLLGGPLIPRFRPAWSAQPKAPQPQPLAMKLGRIYRCRESAKRIGSAYLRGAPNEAHTACLVDCLCAALGLQPTALMAATPLQLRDRLSRHIRQDFAHDRIVNIDGWILAKTEARLCALTALL